MRISLAQVAPQLGDIDANLKTSERLVNDATADGSELVVFPELSLSGYSVGNVEHDPAMGADDQRLAALSRACGDVGILVGFPEISEGLHVYNSMVFLQDGEVLHTHRKVYLPSYATFEERNHFSPGNRMRAFPTPHGRMAVLTCNDAWQPQLAFIAVQDAARVLLIPTCSPETPPGTPWDAHEYWHGITRFYARMFQVYVVFANRVGSEGDLSFWGGSHVVDPWGEVIAEAAMNQEELLTVDIDLQRVRERRREVPLVKEAKLAMLQRELSRLADSGGDL
ncbi:MAG: nitrilase-related carbon-nitrogen hydrolase [Euzebya sp.]